MHLEAVTKSTVVIFGSMIAVHQSAEVGLEVTDEKRWTV
jgi:hypothetical protein